jgi:hypothetical protein
MRRFRTLLVRVGALLLLFSAQLPAAEGGEEAIVIVADSRRFTGWEAWWTNLYNESHLYFALLTVVIVPLVGAILGSITSMAMSRLGINLKSRELAEH